MKRLGALLFVLSACGGSSSGGSADAAFADAADARRADSNPVFDAPPVDATPAPTATIDVNANLTTDPIVPGRVCGAAPWYAVTALTATSATVATAPVDDCLVPGDELLLVNLQGTAAATANTGAWELLRVGALDGTTITFDRAKLGSYGAAAGSDAGIGAGAADQKVALVRVPSYGSASIAAGAVLTATPWDGATGGILALRAESLLVDGTIDASTLGYRAGRWSRDGGCDTNLATEAGESITGPAIATTTRNAGGPGGIAAAAGSSFNSNTPISPSAGHALPGEDGLNASGRTLGEPGAAYGASDGSRLTMGSGSSGNLTCEVGAAIQLVDSGRPGAGIVLLLGGDVTVGAAGAIDASAVDASRDVASSGGMIHIRGGALSLGASQVTARGATANGVIGPTLGMSNHGSPGYVVLEPTGLAIGTTDPLPTILTP